jgi:hypothetical protein
MQSHTGHSHARAVAGGFVVLYVEIRHLREGAPFHVLDHQFWPMALIGVTAFSIAGWLFRHRMY